ncbi:MAG TPA: Imm27 family immunity protein [Longimicrobium sp.]|nr:Imm27 family immunity protein [Longimicrobium sp.]
MMEIARVDCVDRDSGDDAFALLRADERRVGLAVSLGGSGEVAVHMDVEAAVALRDALHRAICLAGGSDALAPHESHLCGKAGYGPDEVTLRIRNLVADSLRKVAGSADGFNQLYQDPRDGRLWELRHLRGRIEPEEPLSLTLVSATEAKERFGFG